MKTNSGIRAYFTKMSESRDPVEGPLGKKLLAALDNSDILKNLNSTELKEIKNWGENNKKAAAAAPDAAGSRCDNTSR